MLLYHSLFITHRYRHHQRHHHHHIQFSYSSSLFSFPFLLAILFFLSFSVSFSLYFSLSASSLSQSQSHSYLFYSYILSTQLYFFFKPRITHTGKRKKMFFFFPRPVCLSVCCLTNLPPYLFVHPSICSYVRPPSMHPSVRPSIRLSICSVLFCPVYLSCLLSVFVCLCLSCVPVSCFISPSLAPLAFFCFRMSIKPV